MFSRREKAWVHNLVLWASISVAIVISPGYSFDPVNIPKFFILVPIALMSMGFCFSNFKTMASNQYRIVTALCLLFLVQMLFVMLFSKGYINQQIFGTFGRNTGFISYVGLISILLSAAYVADRQLNRKLALGLIWVGALSMAYGLLQTTGNDPIKWNNNNSIIAFSGNPDFASSLLGMSCIAALIYFLNFSLSIPKRLIAAPYILLGIYLIVRSHAIQGLIVFGIGALIVFYIFLLKQVKTKLSLRVLFGVLTIPVISFFILGTLKIGPLSHYLYKISVRQRGFYWHAAFNAMKSNPFFGVGLDSFGDNYYRYRSTKAALQSLNVQTNAAHNVFLDFGASGGYTLLLIYLLLVLFAGWRSMNTIRKLESFDPYFTTIFAVWVGFQAQSLISINQIGLAIWGWAFTGVLIGYSYLPDEKLVIPSTSKYKGLLKGNFQKIDFTFPVVGLICGIILVSPKLLADHKYKLITNSGSAEQAIAAAYSFPEDSLVTVQIADIFEQSKQRAQAITLLKHAVVKNPDYYPAWSTLYSLSPANSQESSDSLKNMQRLNPRVQVVK